MKIIAMNASHVDAVAELEKQCFSQPWSRNSVVSELENPLALWLVAVGNENSEFFNVVDGIEIVIAF